MPNPQTLLIDADDTLWENNVLFEEAIAGFLSLLDHTRHTREQLRDRLNSIERETVLEHGYGTHSFHHSLLRCYTELAAVPLTERDREHIRGFARSIVEAEIHLLPGVAEWLPRLAERCRLILVTKGDQAEQIDKLHRSQLAPHFSAAEVLREKDTAAYRALLGRLALDPAQTWMIGNSPKSDINPALEAGLSAVFVRYHATWVLEEEELGSPQADRRLLVCSNFAEAAAHLFGRT